MTFPGELLHGVVPTACAAAEQGAAAAQPRQRLTLLIAWYSEATQRAVTRAVGLNPAHRSARHAMTRAAFASAKAAGPMVSS